LLPTARATADPGFYYPSALIGHLMIYNSAKVKSEDAPRRWTDLLDPKWKGRIATGHPGVQRAAPVSGSSRCASNMAGRISRNSRRTTPGLDVPATIRSP